MDIKTELTIHTLKLYNRWRRGENIQQPHPKTVGQAIDNAINFMEACIEFSGGDSIKQDLHLLKSQEVK